MKGLDPMQEYAKKQARHILASTYVGWYKAKDGFTEDHLITNHWKHEDILALIKHHATTNGDEVEALGYQPLSKIKFYDTTDK